MRITSYDIASLIITIIGAIIICWIAYHIKHPS